MKQAFTLIELLVVVLIIGILAAIALPQYRLAVEKSRAAEALVALRNIKNAMEVCKMETGAVCQKLSDLAIALPGTPVNDTNVQMKDFTLAISGFNLGSVGYEVVATRNDGDVDWLKYYLFYQRSKDATRVTCVATSVPARSICRSLCGRKKLYDADGDKATCELNW